MKLTELFEQILMEASYNNIIDKDFKEMLAMNDTAALQPRVNDFIARAKKHLKRDDRIVWALRIYKLWVMAKLMKDLKEKFHTEVNNTDSLEKRTDALNKSKRADLLFTKALVKYNKKTKGKKYKLMDLLQGNFFGGVTPDGMLVQIEHLLGLGIHEINEYQFGWESHRDLNTKLRGIEKEWARTRKRAIQYDKTKEVFLKTTGNFEWINLESASCAIEGDAMGHCGNSPNIGNSWQTILSLRERVMVKNTMWWKPHATFIYQLNNKRLGEMKGVFNEKPSAKTHPHIVALLKDKRIKGLDGGGYLAGSNFSLDDLDKSTADKLIAKKPELLSFKEHVVRFGLDKSAMKLLDRETKSQFIDGGKKLIISDYPSTYDLLMSMGNHPAQVYANVVSGKIDLDLNTGLIMLEDANKHMNAATNRKYTKYAQEKYPEKMAEREGDWWLSLFDKKDVIFDVLLVTYKESMRRGITQKMEELLADEWENGKHQVYGYPIDVEFSPKKFDMKAPTQLIITTDQLSKELTSRTIWGFKTAVEFGELIQNWGTPNFEVKEPDQLSNSVYDEFDGEYYQKESAKLIATV